MGDVNNRVRLLGKVEQLKLMVCPCKRAACRKAKDDWAATLTGTNPVFIEMAVAADLAAQNSGAGVMQQSDCGRLRTLGELLGSSVLDLVPQLLLGEPCLAVSGTHGPALRAPIKPPSLRTSGVQRAADLDPLGGHLCDEWLRLTLTSTGTGLDKSRLEAHKRVINKVLAHVPGVAATSDSEEDEEVEEAEEAVDAEALSDGEEVAEQEAMPEERTDAFARALLSAEQNNVVKPSHLALAVAAAFREAGLCGYQPDGIAHDALRVAAFFAAAAAALRPLTFQLMCEGERAVADAADSLARALASASALATSLHAYYRHAQRRYLIIENGGFITTLRGRHPSREAVRYILVASTCELASLVATWKPSAPRSVADRERFLVLSSLWLSLLVGRRPASAIPRILAGGPHARLLAEGRSTVLVLDRSKRADTQAVLLTEHAGDLVRLVAVVSAGTFGNTAFTDAQHLAGPLYSGNLLASIATLGAEFCGIHLTPAGLRRLLTSCVQNDAAARVRVGDTLGVDPADDGARAAVALALRNTQQSVLGHGDMIAQETYTQRPHTLPSDKLLAQVANVIAPVTTVGQSTRARVLSRLGALSALSAVTAVASIRGGDAMERLSRAARSQGRELPLKGAVLCASTRRTCAPVPATPITALQALARVELGAPLDVRRVRRSAFAAAACAVGVDALQRRELAAVVQRLFGLSDLEVNSLLEKVDINAQTVGLLHVEVATGLDVRGAAVRVSGAMQGGTELAAGGREGGGAAGLSSDAALALIDDYLRSLLLVMGDCVSLPPAECDAVRLALIRKSHPRGGDQEAASHNAEQIVRHAVLFWGGCTRIGIEPNTVLLSAVQDGGAAEWAQKLVESMHAARKARGTEGYVGVSQCAMVLRLLLAVCDVAVERLALSTVWDREARRERVAGVVGTFAAALVAVQSRKANTDAAIAEADGLVTLLNGNVRTALVRLQVTVLRDVESFIEMYGFTVAMSDAAVATRSALLPRVALVLLFCGTGWRDSSFIKEMVLFETLFFVHGATGMRFETSPPFFVGGRNDGPRRVLLCETAQVLVGWLVATLPYDSLVLFDGWPRGVAAQVDAENAKRRRL